MTIYDVAKEAGARPSTVSRAFSRPGRVSAATHAKVMEAAKALGYRTSAPASRRSAANDTTGSHRGPRPHQPLLRRTRLRHAGTAQEQDFLLLLLDTVEDEARAPSLESAVDVVDGIVLSAPVSPTRP